ncbi:hypothetical protein PMAYCL1PPCAC_00222, partial [Pristionchus mayeri]
FASSPRIKVVDSSFSIHSQPSFFIRVVSSRYPLHPSPFLHSGEMTLNIEPAETSFPATGGSATVKIVSSSESKLAFKVKTSNNQCYRVKPVFGFIEPKADSPLEIMRVDGPPKDDKLVVQWAEVPAEETDPKAPFAAGAQQGEVILPMKAA